MSCDLLSDPYIAELRAMHAEVERVLAALDTLYPLATAEANPCADAVVGGPGLGALA